VKRKAARPSLYTLQLAERLCGAIALGDTIDEACKRVGISRTTFFEWQQTRADFPDLVEAAKIKRLDVLEEAWARAGLKDWKAAQAMLRVLKPKKFAERLIVRLDDELEQVIAAVMEANADDPARLERTLAAIARRADRSASPRSDAAGETGSGGDGGGEGGEAVRAPPAIDEAAPIPRP
jgi:predicted DNA-binding transcriptional regulator AlpA